MSASGRLDIGKAARWYAAHGFPVFPLHSAPGGVRSYGDLKRQATVAEPIPAGA